jgi:hypothetical protein
MASNDSSTMSGAPIAGDEYCRAIESYLCRRNEGHLVRIVGPAFELVSGWSAQGVPLKVVYRGIDRYLERLQAKPARRRPARIEFCAADVLDVFDEWRRALGVMHVRESAGAGSADAADVEDAARHRGSLKTHLERAAARVSALRSPSRDDSTAHSVHGQASSHPLDATLASIEQELRDLAGAGTFRGDARERVISRLRTLDAMLGAAARAQCDAATIARLTAEAEGELAPFRARMTRDAYQQSLEASVERSLREQMRLPALVFD